jgi:hypothetical protein
VRQLGFASRTEQAESIENEEKGSERAWLRRRSLAEKKGCQARKRLGIRDGTANNSSHEEGKLLPLLTGGAGARKVAR